MTDVEITVRGSHSVSMPPEQATVYITVAADGPAPQPVVRQAAGTLAEVRASLESRYDPQRGPVTRFAIEQIRKGSHRPYNSDGVQLPLVHTAAVSVTATFTDIDALASWVDWAAAVDGIAIGYVDWALTESNRLTVERATRQEAVRDAKRRAQDYADALDLGPVAVRSISDPGVTMQRKVVMASAMAAAPDDDSGFTLRPEDVQVEAQVEAKFVVDG